MRIVVDVVIIIIIIITTKDVNRTCRRGHNDGTAVEWLSVNYLSIDRPMIYCVAIIGRVARPLHRMSIGFNWNNMHTVLAALRYRRAYAHEWRNRFRTSASCSWMTTKRALPYPYEIRRVQIGCCFIYW